MWKTFSEVQNRLIDDKIYRICYDGLLESTAKRVNGQWQDTQHSVFIEDIIIFKIFLDETKMLACNRTRVIYNHRTV